MVTELKNFDKLNLFIKLIFIGFFIIVALINHISAADPEGPDNINVIYNETRATVGAGTIINTSGGYIANMNITSTSKNTRWKAFVGNVIGTFTLDDASGATIFDWTFTSTTGRIYATRNSTRVAWANINCSNITHLNAENIAISHSNPDDNVTKTFNATFNAGTGRTISGTHSSFFIGSVSIPANSCPTLNTYISNATQDADFEEIALYDGYSMVYATILENNLAGYDGAGVFDFQMIVPENGSAGWVGNSAYYLYVEIGN